MGGRAPCKGYPVQPPKAHTTRALHHLAKSPRCLTTACTRQGAEVRSLRDRSLRRALQVKPSVGRTPKLGRGAALTVWTPPADLRRMRPIAIGSGASETGPRLGGRPPAGVQTSAMTSDCRYFMTVPLCSATSLELSVFINRDFNTLIEDSGELFRDNRVLLLTHGESERAVASPTTSDVSEHPLLLGAEEDDWRIEEGEEVVRSCHKLGGRPYTMHDPPEFIEGTREAAELGMRHFLQVDFPGYGEHVSGDWPWGDGLFHLFCRGDIRTAEWACFWEF